MTAHTSVRIDSEKGRLEVTVSKCDVIISRTSALPDVYKEFHDIANETSRFEVDRKDCTPVWNESKGFSVGATSARETGSKEFYFSTTLQMEREETV
jgi:hypothetical protein